MSKTLYIASGNAHKVGELQNTFKDFGFEVFGLSDLTNYVSPEETEITFAGNAILKAQSLQNFFRQHQIAIPYILADDSGLVCEDLNGAPGIYSARFAGPDATDSENNTKLITTLKALPNPTLQVQYICSLAWLPPSGPVVVFEANCKGKIIFEPKGEKGFGYDPHMWIESLQKTFAELTPAEKNQISHRGLALLKLIQHLQNELENKHG